MTALSPAEIEEMERDLANSRYGAFVPVEYVERLLADRKVLVAEIERLRDQRDYYKSRDDEGAKMEAEQTARAETAEAQLARYKGAYELVVFSCVGYRLDKQHWRCVICGEATKAGSVTPNHTEECAISRANSIIKGETE